MTSFIINNIRKRNNIICYILLTIWPLLLIILSIPVGVHKDIANYHGYISFKNYNWLMFLFILPFSFFVVRFIVEKILPTPLKNAPILFSIKDEEHRNAAATYLDKRVLSGIAITVALALALAANIYDFWDSPGKYYWAHLINGESLETVRKSLPSHDFDWSFYFILPVGTYRVGVAYNLGYNLLVYSQQFAASFFGFLILVIFGLHNYAFLAMIYQRRWQSSEHKRIVIDLLDRADRCFGFKHSRQIFNIQVLCTAVIGCIMLASRFANVTQDQSRAIVYVISNFLKKNWIDAINGIDRISASYLFPDKGQWLLPIIWLILFFVVFIPALIKILPAFTNPFRYLNLVPYLREFMPDGKWSNGFWEFGESPSKEQEKIIVDEVAYEFAENSFWPNGDNTASVMSSL